MTAAPHPESNPTKFRLEATRLSPMAGWARWLVVISMVVALTVLFGSWAFLAERAKVDVRADRAVVPAAAR